MAGKNKVAESKPMVARAELGEDVECKGYQGTFWVSGNALYHDLELGI